MRRFRILVSSAVCGLLAECESSSAEHCVMSPRIHLFKGGNLNFVDCSNGDRRTPAADTIAGHSCSVGLRTRDSARPRITYMRHVSAPLGVLWPRAIERLGYSVDDRRDTVTAWHLPHHPPRTSAYRRPLCQSVPPLS